MDFFGILFLSTVSIIFGIILTLCIQYYIVYFYLKKGPIVSSYVPKNFLEYSLPNAIKKQLENENLTDKSKGGLAISLVLQFLFHELRHSEGIRRWLYKKLSLELDELLTKTALGKFFESISIRDMHLGTQFPDIKDISIDNVKLDDQEQHLETVSLCLNVDYTGNFMLSVDAKMRFGKTAYLSIKVERISGLARLQFSRQPYTHWSFSFFQEPTIDLAVESHFQGRQLQANITNLIMNQIKKAIKRKHTLPNYKLRYKPFFVKTDPSQLESEESDILPYGQLEVNIAEVSRLSIPENVQAVYCTVAVDSIPWISLYQKDDATCMTLEITMTKLKQAQLGVIFRQDYGCVTVDSVANNSGAYQAGLRSGDLVISVENKLVNTVPQVAKFMKSISGTNVTLRIERVVENYVIKAKNYDNIKENKLYDSIPDLKFDEDDAELTQLEQESFVIIENVKKEEKKPENKPNKSPKIITSNENMAKLVQNISSFSLRKRKVGGSVPSTPNRTPKLQHIPAKKSSIVDLPEIVRTDLDGTESEHILSYIEVFRGKDLPPDPLLPFDDDFRFSPRDGAKYINVNAWGIVPDAPDVLLGYMNVPLGHVATECSVSVLGNHSRRYSFLPPGVTSTASAHPLRAHSGFEHVFCFGDALLCFCWTPLEGSDVKRKTATITEEKSEVTSSSNKHDFVRTQFHGTTHCDFCSKKIWLKDAVRCRQCGMSCHKKCVAKCQQNNTCTTSCDTIPQMRSEVSLSDVILTADGEDGEILDGNIKRVNSVTNLTIPGFSSPQGSSKSLPPSPNRTPSRKQSLVAVNPFTLCPTALEEVYKNPAEAHEVVAKLLEQVMQCPVDDTLMDNAKESGQRMYSGLEPEEKVEKINLMMAELKKSLDYTTCDHRELSTKLSLEESEVDKAKTAFLMGQSDAKVHALSALMLHYCSGLQYTQEKIV